MVLVGCMCPLHVISMCEVSSSLLFSIGIYVLDKGSKLKSTEGNNSKSSEDRIMVPVHYPYPQCGLFVYELSSS